ncbi:M24 family metallopeptidase [Halobellus limi]|uniref:Aminopeptidase P family protein n=1 Tax=Halobellus limi TaxID=699433 RepID=A0A1H6CN37_9EURY|nr:M24 family metallopeptidase [Halobellus limi]QCC48715.1 aminopeptidase P family protein [Halobellus limi]SEG74382.1 Xaa-Pro aminopeptidase [Halobellus limi]
MTDDRDPSGATAGPSAAPPARDPPPSPAPPTTDRSFLDAALDERDAVGFVAVGDRRDADLRFLTRFEGSEDDCAYVRTLDADVLCAPRGHVARAARRFDGRVSSDRPGDHPGERAAAVLDGVVDAEQAAPRTVLVPSSIPHDAAVYLERAGYELRSTTAVADARATKTDGELDAVRAVQRAAVRATDRGERVLAAAETDDGDELRWGDAPLTAERLRRVVNAELARRGVDSAGNTVVAAGATGSESADEPIATDEPVRIDVAPREPHGYHGFRSRTVAVDSDGGWERRAYVAVEAALEAALDEVEPGADAADVRREAEAELTAFGFDPTGGSGEGDPGGDPIETGHGVGLSRRERPFLRAGETLDVGCVLAVAPGLTDPEHGSVRLGDLVVVTEAGYELVGDGTRSFAPQGRY